MARVQTVALVALMYRELARRRYEAEESLIEDFESCPGDVSLLAMIGADSAALIDWKLVEAIGCASDGLFTTPPLRPLLDMLADNDLVRCEALLHAWPEVAWSEIADARWAPALLSRWEAVEERIEELRASGVTTSRDDVDLIADFAYRKGRLDLLTGQRFDRSRRN